MTQQFPVVRAAPGPPLGTEQHRTRPGGRIGGLIGVEDTQAASRLAQALGLGCQFLGSHGASVVADWDCCWLEDQGVPDLDRWRSLLDAERLPEVEGAFAVAWTAADGTLRLARDAIGERTLYYAPLPAPSPGTGTGMGLIFASTIRALLASGRVPPRLNRRAGATYLTYAYLPGRETLVEGVYEVLPGEIVAWSCGRLTRSSHWSVPAEAGDQGVDEERLRRELRGWLERAVQRRLPSGEPVGATLSGGVDSSLVVALARQLHDAPVHTYSVSFGPEYPNELPFSSLVADHCATQHRIVELSPSAVLHHLDEAIGLLSDPIGDPLTVPNALLFREAASTIGVMLNGEGGDPCFGGPKNAPMLLAALLGDGANGDEGFARERSYLRAHQKCFDDLPSMLTPDVLATVAERSLEGDIAPLFENQRWCSLVGKLMAVNVMLKGGHHILPKVDAVSAPFGVLPRSPLFDRAVVEMAFRIPPRLKLHGSVEKYLLKRAVADLLPPAILQRPKSGMLVPVERWFQGPLRPHAQERLLDGLGPYNLVRRDYLERLLKGRLGGLRPRHGAKIWLLLTLESWLRTTLGGAN